MKVKKINIKLMVSVLLFAILLPFGLNFATSGAFNDKEKLKRVAEKYNLEANLENLTINVPKDIDVYLNSYDAKNKKNSVAKYSAGDYYVYKLANSSVNISKNKASSGGWVSLESLRNTKKSKKVVSNDKFALTKTTDVFLSAYDAAKDENPVKKYNPGEYYIFKELGDVINISKIKNVPGAWVKASEGVKGSDKSELDVVVTKKPSEKQSKASEKSKESSDTDVKVILKERTKVYITAFDAISGVNSPGTMGSGEYYIYKVSGDAINISKNPNQAGGWILKSVVENGSDSKIKEETKEVSPSKSKENKKELDTDSSNNTKHKKGSFLLYLDPGHGPGRVSNRGGLLFNEGDQNFEFTQTIIKAAKKYANLTVKTTRSVNDSDPSLSERARMSSEADLFISIHSNAASPEVRGVEMWGSNSNKSHQFAKEVTEAWERLLNTKNRGVKYARTSGGFSRSANLGDGDIWGVFRGNRAKEKYILESVFHTNYKDSKVYLEKQEILADKLLELVAKHFDLKLK